MTREQRCIACAYERRILHRTVRENERRARNGQPVDLTAIETAKRLMADCAGRGHHDSAEAGRRQHAEPRATPA
jgi:hypothetical protein